MGFFRKKKIEAPRGRRAGNSEKGPVYAYYNNREQDPEAKQNRKKNGRFANIKDFLHSLPGYIAVAVILGCIFYSFGLTTNPKIIVVNDQEQGVQPFLRTPEAYKSAVAEQLSNSILNRTKLSINTAKTEEAIKQQLPEVGQASITLPIIGRNPVVYLKIAEPAFVLQPEGGAAFVIDNQGRAVVPASELPQLTHDLVRIDDKSGLPVEQGKTVLPTDQIAFLHEVRAQLAAANVAIDHFSLPPEANALRVHPAKAGYYVKLNFLSDPREQVGRYLAVRKKANPQTYIDVRVDDRVYVR